MNDVPCGLVPYIDWLISRDERDRSKMGKPLEYTNRRRLTHYSIMTDSAKVVGYSVKNPITGYNYAYRYRFNPRFAKVMDGVLENAWVVGLSTTLIGSAFIWRSRGWKVMAAILGVAIASTEAYAWYWNNVLDWVKLYKTEQGILNHMLYVRSQGPGHTDFPSFMNIVKMFEPNNNPNGDLEWAAGAFFNMRVVDKIDLQQGISFLSSAVSAGTIFSFWQRGGRKLNYWWWWLAAEGHANLFNNIRLWATDSKVGDVSIGHGPHAWGHAVGLILAWMMK